MKRTILLSIFLTGLNVGVLKAQTSETNTQESLNLETTTNQNLQETTNQDLQETTNQGLVNELTEINEKGHNQKSDKDFINDNLNLNDNDKFGINVQQEIMNDKAKVVEKAESKVRTEAMVSSKD